MTDDQKEFTGGLADVDRHDDEWLRNFVAIQDIPPQKTLFLNVSGEVLVGNPGIDVELTYAIPQGINPSILLLRVVLRQRPGIWPQVMTWKSATYTRMIGGHNQYSQATIDHPTQDVTIDVIDK